MTVRQALYSVIRMTAGFAFACGLVASAAAAEETNADPVFVFNRICYAQVPDVDAIRAMAQKLAWHRISDEDLELFTTSAETKVALGWDAQIGEQIFRVGVVQSKPPESMKAAFPDMIDGTSTSCSLILNENHSASEFGANMQVLAGKEPVSRDVGEGEFLTTTWAGGNDAIKVFLFSKANKSGQGGLLNVTVLAK